MLYSKDTGVTESRTQAEGVAPFVCAICERTIEAARWVRNFARDGHIAPVCKSCEQPKSNSQYGMGGSSGGARVRHGSFMDRRIAHQLGALAEELHQDAKNWEWRKQRYGA